MAFAGAKGADLPAARNYFEASRGEVAGNGRKAAEKYIEARLMEEKGMGEEGNVGLRNTAEAHRENFSSYTVQEGAVLSMERLWDWRRGGKLSELGLPVSFYGKYAKALFRAGEDEHARDVYREGREKVS